MEKQKYCKKLIEVDLLIKRIGAYSKKEMSIQSDHYKSLHIWWARRPAPACRAIILSSLILDPYDANCPSPYVEKMRDLVREWVEKNINLIKDGSALQDLIKYKNKPSLFKDNLELRKAVLILIAEFSNWSMSAEPKYLSLMKKLVKLSSNNNNGDINKYVLDPFAGRGTFPLEALRIGENVYSGDLNSIAVLYNKVMLEILPRCNIGDLSRLLKLCGEKLIDIGHDRIQELYPKAKDGRLPIAYLWARNINCEGPGCGVIVPTIKQYWLSKKTNPKVAIKPVITSDKIQFEIIKNPKGSWPDNGTIARGNVVCPKCGYVTKNDSVKRQLKIKAGGGQDATLLAVVMPKVNGVGKEYRMPVEDDLVGYKRAIKKFEEEVASEGSLFKLFPFDELPLMSGVFNVPIYGIDTWIKQYNPRQALCIATFYNLIKEKEYEKGIKEPLGRLSPVVQLFLALAVSNTTHYLTTTSTWFNGMLSCFIQGQALPMKWDFAEAVPCQHGFVGSFGFSIDRVLAILENKNNIVKAEGNVIVDRIDATKLPLPDDSVKAFITDPPYYNSIPYADLSDFFYVWLRNILYDSYPSLFSEKTSTKETEIVEMSGWDSKRYPYKTKSFYEKKITEAMAEGRRVTAPDGIGVIVFAHKDTKAWESLLNGLISAGWQITASWPIDTERQERWRANASAALSSSIHLVCRPRENPDGSLITDFIGDWRDVLQELPKKIHEWMPRLAQEGIIGADAIFACLGPALEIFSKYSDVEKANGEKVELREYLEQVWAAVAKEALNMIFEGAHTEGFEEDSRLTAMWLWTLSTSANGKGKEKDVSTEEDENGSSKAVVSSGFSLEFDAARKIAQGLGAHLESLSNLIEIKGDKARLLPVSERVKSLFGKDSSTGATYKRKKKEKQLTLFDELKTLQEEDWSLGDTKAEIGKTVLDRLHQSMILFGSGRGEALRRFLVEEGVGKDERFWRLAQALSALYPSSTDEKRWVDGVLAKKKSFGL